MPEGRTRILPWGARRAWASATAADRTDRRTRIAAAGAIRFRRRRGNSEGQGRKSQDFRMVFHDTFSFWLSPTRNDWSENASAPDMFRPC